MIVVALILMLLGVTAILTSVLSILNHGPGVAAHSLEPWLFLILGVGLVVAGRVVRDL